MPGNIGAWEINRPHNKFGAHDLNKSKITALIFVKILITGGLIYWLFSRVDVDNLAKILVLIKPSQIIGAIFLHIAVFLFGWFRWWLLFRHIGTSSPFLKTLPSYYLGVFFNNVLPTGMGGDAIRTFHLTLRGLSLKVLVASAIVDRVIGLVVVLAIGATGFFLSLDSNLVGSRKIFLLIAVLAVVTASWLFLAPRFIGLVERLAHKYQHTRIRKGLLVLISLCYSYGSAKKLLLAAIGLTVAMQGLVIFIYYYLGSCIGLELPFVTYLVVIPIVAVAASLPISIGGLGVREGALVGLLVTGGADGQLAIALSLLFLLVLWVASLPGSLMLLTSIKNKSRLKVDVTLHKS